MPFSPCKHHITFVSGQIVPPVLAVSLPDTSGRARQQAEASRTAGTVTARPLGQQGGMAGKDTIDKGRRRIARSKAIPGKQAVRELLNIERNFL